MSNTPRLGAPQVATSSGTPGEDCNEQCAYFDQGAGHFTIVDRDLTAPPGTPRTDASYLVKATATGAWTGLDGKIVFLVNGSWTPVTVKEGMSLWIEDEDLFLVALSGSTFQTFATGGIAIQSVTSAATVTPTFANDQVNITAQAAALTLANPTGTAVDGWGLSIRIKDNGTARSITFGSQYRALGVTLPTTTVISKTLYLGLVFNNADTKWDVVAVAQEA